VDELARERRDGPRTDEHAALAVGHDLELLVARVLLIGNRSSDRAREVESRDGDVDALLARLARRQADRRHLGIGEGDARDR
jgi:hypothetical protein